jgi:hypothetical protein
MSCHGYYLYHISQGHMTLVSVCVCVFCGGVDIGSDCGDSVDMGTTL